MDDIYTKMGKRAFGAAAAKRPAPCAMEASPAAKKPADPPNGLFQDQPSPAPSPLPPSTEKVPPFFIDQTPDWPALAARLKELVEGDFAATVRGDKIRVATSSIAHFRAIQRYLHTTAKVPFHTFELRSRRCLKVVISGLPRCVTSVDLETALGEEGFAVENTARMRSRRGKSGKWLVTLVPEHERDEGDRRSCEIYQLRDLFHVRLQVDSYSKPPGPSQCHHCQGFGHGSGSCGRPVRCVRCGGPHKAANCLLPATARGPCCNCGGEHNANWRGCSAYQAAKTAATPRAQRRPPPRHRHQQRPALRTVMTESAEEDESPPTDEEGFVETRRRRRQPRNPANRGPRADHRPAPGQEARPATRHAAPPEKPRPRPDWPRKQPAPEQPAPTAETAVDSAATAAAERREIIATLVEILAKLTTLTEAITKLAQRQ